MATKTDICNLALVRMGVSIQLSNVDTDTSKEALTLKLVFDGERDIALGDFPWSWATKYAALTGSSASPNADWAFSYTYPGDCVRVRRIATTDGRLNPNPPAFRIGADGAGTKKVFTDVAAGTLEYTVQITDPTKFDATFNSMLAWRLTAQLALGLSRMPDVAKVALEAYGQEKQAAEMRAALEGQKDTVESADAVVVEILNMALMRIGVTKDNEPSASQNMLVQARLLKQTFETERDFVLRAFAWSWATKYVTPDGTGSSDEPTNGDWVYEYPYPDDAVAIRRIVSPLDAHGVRRRRSWQIDPLWPPPFKVGLSSDGTERVIWTNETDATFEYTVQVTNSDVWDAAFKSMLAWRIAMMVAPSRIPDPKVAQVQVQRAEKGFFLELSAAQAEILNEAQPDEPDEAEWVRAR